MTTTKYTSSVGASDVDRPIAQTPSKPKHFQNHTVSYRRYQINIFKRKRKRKHRPIEESSPLGPVDFTAFFSRPNDTYSTPPSNSNTQPPSPVLRHAYVVVQYSQNSHSSSHSFSFLSFFDIPSGGDRV
ncbi:hypothetical protein SERLADRAFT_439047 [Serpula lacrymans var. lacrymans S7.9]|uniref:Uncharacterized protein n=1 Tax=Serpula lacrymans var. lacrymans (strain S7.9) TaxID=578457 RepID=F8NYR7_SERL9|nr:uncharacterized protein SERLADRAFT_439047 [Serpula lacrymans var. lacrymans S7.9]EGO23738.1 hypothetical protein SERLADRAFT_439047 [Serpula lacrymans var. lacrymans S7.9]